MTNLQALKARVNYPQSDANAEVNLIARGVAKDGEFSEDIANSKGFRLAYADTLRFIVTMVNLSQGGSITAQSIPEIRATANAIYKEYGETEIGTTGEKPNVIEDCSDDWT